MLVDGVDVRDLDPAACAARSPWSRTTRSCSRRRSRDNIAYARPDASDDGGEAAPPSAPVSASVIDELPDGLDTLVGERGHTLSGGQRQRVAIARALLAEPRILILDDATSSVDATTESRIKSALAEVMEGRTTFVIAHRLSTIALADEVVVLEDGEIAARGTHDELLGELAALPRDRREGPAGPGLPHALRTRSARWRGCEPRRTPPPSGEPAPPVPRAGRSHVRRAPARRRRRAGAALPRRHARSTTGSGTATRARSP